MGINIGNNNNFKNSPITENKSIYHGVKNKTTIINVIILGLILPLLVGVILKFDFWEKIIKFIENVFRG